MSRFYSIIASRLEERVEERFRPYFKKRGMYEWVIIVDWFTTQPTSDPKIPIELMLITLNKVSLKFKGLDMFLRVEVLTYFKSRASDIQLVQLGYF